MKLFFKDIRQLRNSRKAVSMTNFLEQELGKRNRWRYFSRSCLAQSRNGATIVKVTTEGQEVTKLREKYLLQFSWPH